MTTTIDANTDSLTAVLHTVTGGRIRVVLEDARAKPGERSGRVVDGLGNHLGTAQDYIYQGRGFAVQTRAFGGFVPVEQIDFVCEGGWADNLKQEYVDALRTYAARRGRTWKAKLRTDWEYACARVEPDLQQPMQWLRNSRGPGWLAKVRL